MKAAELTPERLCALLDYDPETNEFTWKVSRRGHAGKAKAGAVAGTPHGRGYVCIGIDGRRYYKHQLVSLWLHGRFPARRRAVARRVRENGEACYP